MDLRRLRIGLAGALALAGAAALGPWAPGALADHPLEPDLKTLKLSQSDLVMDRAGDRVLLRLTNEVGNKGAGPLEVVPGMEADGCQVDPKLAEGRRAFQRLFADTGDNGFDREEDVTADVVDAGCMQYHPPHNHWHVVDFAEYTLFDDEIGQPAARGGKAGFCLFDNHNFFPGLPGAPEEQAYTGAGCGSEPDDPPDLEGISVGWSDIYTYSTPGQRINVTGLPAGKYCLVSEANPEALLTEMNTANNDAQVRIRLRPGRLEVRRLSGDCRNGP